MKKKLIAGAAVLALLMNSPQLLAAEEDVVIFGGEFDDETPKPKPVEKPEPIRDIPPPVVEKPEPVVEKPEPIIEKTDPQPQPVIEKPAPVTEVEEDDALDDVLIFDDVSGIETEPVEEPIQKPEPVVEEPKPVEEPFKEPKLEPVNEPFEESIKNPPPVNEQVIIVPPPVKDEPEPRREERPKNDYASDKKLKQLQSRFIKLAVDETYIYYLDKNSVQWRKIPYLTSEYMADVWIRMIEREPRSFDDDMDYYSPSDSSPEIMSARARGYRYCEEDLHVLRRQNYVLGHYYLRTKTKQIQFLSEQEVFGRPQNTLNERPYDHRNWENLVPGSVEAAIYNAVVQIIDTTKDNSKGHMTFSDMLDEYLRISL